jgi:hypothetical protein
MRLYPPNEVERADRQVVMVSSHIVWGAALGTALEQLAATNDKKSVDA